jgi:hypothetical protein
MKRGTMVDRESKVFAGSRGGFFKKSPWPPEASIGDGFIYIFILKKAYFSGKIFYG